MAGYSKVKRECDRNNRSRGVYELHSMQAERFWENADGNFMITGGTAEERQAQLACCLMAMRRKSSAPIILLNHEKNTEELLIRMATDGHLGRLAVFSPAYPNYEILYRAEPGIVSDLLANTMTGENSVDMQLYVDAFLEILSTEYPVSLSTILALSKYTDEQLAAFGEQHGAYHGAVQDIQHYADAGKYFRSLLNRIYRAVSGITTRGCDTHFNCIQAGMEGKPLIVLIDMQTQYPELLYDCLAAELRTLLGEGQRFHIVLNEIPHRLNDWMQRLLWDLQKNNRNTVGICTENIISWSEEPDRLVQMTQSAVVLNSKSWNTASLDRLLKSFGTYDYYEPVMSKGTPAKLFAVLTDEHWTAGHTERERVRAVDMERFQALLKGHQGWMIALARRIRYPNFVWNMDGGNLLFPQGE